MSITTRTITSIDSNLQQRTTFVVQVVSPVDFIIGRVFTGFGVGCGIGIGLGPSICLGAIPVVQQVMSAVAATIGATDALSGAGKHVNDSLRRFGVKKAGVGCGVGFGHGYGAGIALSPVVVHRFQSSVAQTMAKVMMKIGAVPGLSKGQSMLPPSLQSSVSVMSDPPMQNPGENITSLSSKNQEQMAQMQIKSGDLDIESAHKHNTPKGKPPGISLGRKKVFVLQNSAFKVQRIVNRAFAVGKHPSAVGFHSYEVPKQQKVTDDQLMEENEKSSSDSSRRAKSTAK